MDQLFKGSIITVYSRQLTVVEYADAFTTREFGRKSQSTVAMVMQEAMADLGKIIDSVCRDGFTIAEMRMLQVRPPYPDTPLPPPDPARTVAIPALGGTQVNNETRVAMKLSAEDAVAKWQVGQ